MEKKDSALHDYPFHEMELLEERDELLQIEIPPLEEALHAAQIALEHAQSAPLNTLPRRECKRLCHPCRIKEGRLECAATKPRECVFAVEFAAFREGNPDMQRPSDEYRAIPAPDVIRAGLIKSATRAVSEIQKKLTPLCARLEQIHHELDTMQHEESRASQRNTTREDPASS